MRDGYRKLAQALRIEPALPGRVRLMLWVLAVSAFGVGVQAAFFPRSFYDDFPFGRGWVAMDGRYNEHLIRDVGVLNLALLVADDRRARRRHRGPSPASPRSRGSSIRCRTSLYHLRHLTMSMAGVDKVGIVVSLSVPVVAAIVVLFDRTRVQPAVIDVRDSARAVSLTSDSYVGSSG